MHGNAKMTGGGLMKNDLTYNKAGKIVSKKMSKMAKKEMRLQKAGYITTKGVFGVKKMSGGAKVSSFDFDNIKADGYLLVKDNDYKNAVRLIVKEKGDLMIEYTLADTLYRTTPRVFKNNIIIKYNDFDIKTIKEVQNKTVEQIELQKQLNNIKVKRKKLSNNRTKVVSTMKNLQEKANFYENADNARRKEEARLAELKEKARREEEERLAVKEAQKTCCIIAGGKRRNNTRKLRSKK